ncbi:PREDICTED: transcription factor BIM1 isoform X2 [Tarenaya hassleriana]|uniref:transcription factor BIM1 isoform X2 n=1 Tax=Tarenaya hassleriana TaxID=28532 RepID=UPI00053C9FA9|nr:PREDICTED: transcription factor BIM1 isoform X2 [Tarenaya hassleriana]
MELPQPRPFETEGRKPSRDFLSLCSHSTAHPDPRTPPQGGYLKTHDFLRPLEHVGIRGGAKEETSSVDTSASKDPQPPSSVDQHVLPGGIGTYTISHIPYFHQRIPKPEDSPMFTLAQASGCERNTDENSNCSSHAASGFTLWDESAGKKGGKKKENVEERASLRDAATAMGQWPGADHRNSFSSGSSSQVSGLKSQSFMDMIRSAKVNSQDDDEEELVMRTESPSTSQKVDLRVKADGDRKPNTPRSKHSATEQRRRSKINDRFQMLRQLIPNSDQKRDKASFLLEVVEYIQFLQEKVNKHEGSYYRGWNPEPGKLMNWRNSQRLPPEGSVAFAPKLEEKNNIPMPQTVIPNAKGGNAMDPQCRAGKPFPVLTGSPISQFPTRNVSEHRRDQTQPCDGVPSEGEGVIESGSISIASVYSQGLMKKLTQALESSGVDLTQASISVQIELPTHSSLKDEEVRRTRPRTETDDDGGHKKLKTDIH